ncbi:DUF222 domain-containing protein [Microbacterium sp. B2969]|uniref:DUF222 domain-containing protein n=1 Tax=Microbacterium alkaliflavum TaxID=3248839 RepID=A0ABW7QB61_9MICO
MSTLPQRRLVESVRAVCVQLGGADPAPAIASLDDDGLMAALTSISDAQRALQVLGALVTAEVSRRSERELGYAGLAQRQGHRTGTDLVQSVTGQTRSDVRKATEAGKDLRASAGGAGTDASATSSAPTQSWFAPLVDALRNGVLSREQYDAIRRGLGEPPVERYPELEADFLTAAWGVAAAALVREAQDRGVEDLASAARLARDGLDPAGVQLRFDERFERRSFRAWIDQDGQHHARIVFDDEAAVWVHTILNAALRPRRGPRFVNPDAPPDVTSTDDPRTTEQLQYDTLMAVLRTGAAADPAQAFGDRQPGIRIVVTEQSLAERDAVGRPVGTAFAEETGQALPASVAERYLCDAAARAVLVSAEGAPLDVGRDRRLFTERQRVAMAVRDGGCLDCGAEPSRCEAHHLRHWVAHHGRTDLADGVLLCRNCHMRVHNLGGSITRIGSTYYLHLPGKEPRELRPRSLLRFQRSGAG